VPKAGIQNDLFSQPVSNQKSEALMSAMDDINRKMGREFIKLASEGFKRPWKMKQENKSSNYTTDWSGLVRIGDLNFKLR
jgi:DNA polymerase V